MKNDADENVPHWPILFVEQMFGVQSAALTMCAEGCEDGCVDTLTLMNNLKRAQADLDASFLNWSATDSNGKMKWDFDKFAWLIAARMGCRVCI